MSQVSETTVDRQINTSQMQVSQTEVAIDEGWKTLKSWWLTAHPDSWTSVSFVIDKKGVVRFMHLGGEYPPDSADYEQMEKWIELLAEPA